MNRNPFRLLLSALALCGALNLAACQSPAADPPLKGATMGGPLALVAPNGRRTTPADFAGKYRIVYFGFTFCPDVCPVDLALIGAGLRRFEESDPARAARVLPVFITVDPARDTPAVMRAYAARFHPRILPLSGSEADIAQAARAYAIFYQRQEPAAPGGDYLVDHSRQIVLYGPEGEPLALLPHDQGPAAFTAELERWVR